MNPRRARSSGFLVLLLAFASLAGCVQTPDAEEYAFSHDAYEFDGTYTWRAPWLTDGQGTLVEEGEALKERPEYPDAVQQMVPGHGAEPNVGIASDGSVFITNFDDVVKSVDYGASWERVYRFTTPNYPVTVDYYRDSDPMLWLDKDTDRVFALMMHPGTTCYSLAYSDDGGATWSDKETDLDSEAYSCPTPYVDHPKIITAPPGPSAPAAVPDVVAPYPNLVYVCVNKVAVGQILGTWCAVSYDGGDSFVYERLAIPVEDRCPSINGHPAAFPDGTVVVPAGNLGNSCQRKPTVAVTEDNGLTWDVRSFPGDFTQREIDPDIAITPDGTAYMLARDDDQRAYLFRSTDKFQTWEGPFHVSPPDQTLNTFAGLAAGSDGRIAMAYLGTSAEQEDGATPSNATAGSLWHAYVTVSFDADQANPTFLTQQVTPEEDPVQVGAIWLLGGGNPARNLLDFIDASVGPDGRFYASITDGCTPRQGCTGDPMSSNYQSGDRQSTLLVQRSGLSLFADVETLEPVDLDPPRPVPRHPEGNATESS